MANLALEKLLQIDGPTCLIIRASLEPVGGVARFQPAGFPEVGHVLYDAPRGNNTVRESLYYRQPRKYGEPSRSGVYD